MVHLLGEIVKMERSLTVERTISGLRRYREAHQNDRIGRGRHSKTGKDLPVGRPRRVFDREQAAEMAAGRKSIRQIAVALNVGATTVQRFLSDAPRHAKLGLSKPGDSGSALRD
jgi:putative DNA-invertase from lambdoid prophage Rac